MDAYEPTKHNPKGRDILYGWALAIVASVAIPFLAQAGGL